jgi:hypothetical protein
VKASREGEEEEEEEDEEVVVVVVGVGVGVDADAEEAEGKEAGGKAELALRFMPWVALCVGRRQLSELV